MDEFDDALLDEIDLDDLDDVPLTEDDIAKLVDEAPEIAALTPQSLKKLVLNLEKKVNVNQEMRIKFGDDPTKFMDSEVALDLSVRELSLLALSRELYPQFISMKAVPTLVSLLVHENTDVTLDVVSLLNDLVAPDEGLPNPDDEQVANLVEELVLRGGLPALVTNLQRLDESQEEDRQGVFNTLSVVEHGLEVLPELSEVLTEQTAILDWLMKRIEVAAFEDNKLYASEILSILIQDSPNNRKQFCSKGGIDSFLVALSRFKKKDPSVGDEEEYVQNLFNTLCSCLLEPENKDLFISSEGFALMIRMMRFKGFCRNPAIKVVSYGLQNSSKCCRNFVSGLGLGSLFAAFMRRASGKRRSAKKRKLEPSEVEDEHVINCIASLLSNLPEGSKTRARVVKKFVENEFQKTERLVELHMTYFSRVAACEARIRADREARLARGETVGEAEEEEYFLSRLDGGLFTLQLIDYSFAQLCISSNDVRRTGETLLSQEGCEMKELASILVEYGGGDINADDPLAVEVKRLLAHLGW